MKLILHFTNDTLLKGNEFTDMYLEDIKTGNIYDPKFEKLDIRTYDKITTIKVFLNFGNIPVGTYYLNYIYKKRKYEKPKTITTKERETAYYKIDKGSCTIETKDNPYCDFQIYSKSNTKPINLEYSLTRKENGDNTNHKINIKKCQVVKENKDESEYTLRCTIGSIEFKSYFYPSIYETYKYFILKEFKINDNIFPGECENFDSWFGYYRFLIKSDEYFK